MITETCVYYIHIHINLFSFLGGFSFGTPSTQPAGNVSFGTTPGQAPASTGAPSFSFGGGTTPAAAQTGIS